MNHDPQLHHILLESGTNELEILELFIDVQTDGKLERCHFGVNVAKVMQVIESPGFTHPKSASNDSFLGIIGLREHIVPILDLAVWLGLDRPDQPSDVVMVTEFSQNVTGFLVSGVTEIHRVGWGSVAPPDNYLSRVGENCIVGVVELSGKFIQLLDLERALSDFDPSIMENAGSSRTHSDKDYKLLVADDSGTIRLMLQKTLDAAGLSCILVDNGSKALDKLRQYKQRVVEEARPLSDFVDILVADIEMPLMDGFSLTKTVKADEILGKLPVILYSSIITDELRHKGESVGADMQLAKPEMHLLAEKAIALLERIKAASNIDK